MDVRIKDFNVGMSVKSAGVEFEVKAPGGGKQLGDCYVTMTGLTWCQGKTTKVNGVKVSWQELAELLASPAVKKAALKAARVTT